MPDYYGRANQGTAFSDGLMAGYEFVDRIRNRRRALELEERAQARADRGLELAENADSRAQRGLEISEEERIRDNTREDVLDARGTTLFEQQQDEFGRARRVRDETEGARRELASGLLEGGGPTSLSAVGAAGTQRARIPTATPSPVRDSGQSANVRDSGQPTGPVDLRSVQKTQDDSPNFIERLLSGPTEKSATKLWDSVADPNDNSAAILQGRGKAITTADIRRDPAKFADKYFSERDKVSPQARASLDLTMGNALKERRATLAAEGNTRGAARIDEQLAQLAKSATSSAAADGGITRPVKVDDTRVVPAITTAAAKARQAQPVLEATPDELRAATTVVGRIGSAKRLNEKQISALTTLYAHGQIDAEQLNNWSKYGTPIAPKPPSVQALGGGYAAIVTEQGISIMQLPGSDKGESASSRSNRRLLVNDRLKQLNDGVKGMVEAGELSDGSPNQHMVKFLQILKREAPNLQLKSGIPLLADDGALNLAETDPGEVAELLSSYAAYDKGEEQPWFFKGGKTFSEYAPQAAGGEEILDLTGAFQ